MEAAAERYGKEIHDQLKMYPTWFPDEENEVGDFGTLTKNIFNKEGNLKNDFGLKYSVGADGSAHPAYEFSSKGLRQTKIQASGTAASPVGTIGASLRLAFGSAYSVFFNLQDCSGLAMKDKFKFKKDILDLTETGRWDTRYFIVTRIVKAGVATIIQSSESNGEIDLNAANNSTPIDDIFKVAGGVSFMSQKSIGFTCFAKQELKPLLRLGRVKTRFLRKPDFEPSALETSGIHFPRIGINPFKSAVKRTSNVALSSPKKGAGHVYLTVRMPQRGGYADVKPVLDLLHHAGTFPSHVVRTKAVPSGQVGLEPLEFAVERTNGVDFGLSQPTTKGHVLLNVKVPHIGGFADMRPMRQLLLNLEALNINSGCGSCSPPSPLKKSSNATHNRKKGHAHL